MNFPEVVTIQSASISQSASGEEMRSWAALHEDVPARISAATQEARGPSMTVVTDEFNVLLRGGFTDVGTDERVLTGDDAYDITAVAINPRRNLTWLRAKKPSPEGER